MSDLNPIAPSSEPGDTPGGTGSPGGVGSPDFQVDSPQSDDPRKSKSRRAALQRTSAERDDGTEILQLAQSQYETAGTIYGSSNPVEILDALVSFVNAVYTHAHLALIADPVETTSDDTGSLTLLAEYQDRRVIAARRTARLEDYPAYDTYGAVEVLNVQNVATDPFLTDTERARLENQGVWSMLVIPMVVSQRLIGLIAFTHPTSVSLSAARLRALRSLADQAAVVFENQSLLRNTSGSLEEVRTLYDINRVMLGAVDTMDVLRVLRSQLAPTAETILHLVSADGGLILKHVTSPDGERFVDTPVQVTLSVDTLSGTQVEFIENAASTDQVHPLHSTLLNRSGRLASYVVITLRDDYQVSGGAAEVIAMTFVTSTTFDARTRRLYAAVADQMAIVLQNQRLLLDAQTSAIQLANQLRTLRTLNELSINVTTFEDEQSLLNYGIRTLTTLIGVDHGGLLLIDPDRMSGTTVAEYPNAGAVGTRIDIQNNPISRWLLQNPTDSIVIDNVALNQDLPDDLRTFLSQKLGIHSMIILPLIMQDKLIGSIGLDVYREARTFAPDVLQTAQTMAAQLGTALQNIRLLTETRRRAAQLQRIASFGQSVQATLQPETIFTIMFAECAQMLPAQTITIVLFDPIRAALRESAAYDDGAINVTFPTGQDVTLSGTAAAQVWDSGQSLWVGDTTMQKDVPPLGSSIPNRRASASARSYLIAPIVTRRQSVGLVTVTSQTPYAFAQSDAVILEQMVNQLAVALENSRAFAQSQRTAQNEALINEISAQLQQYSTIEDMLQVTLRELGRALGARRGRVRLATQIDDQVGVNAS